jgi:hypothetical protein
LRDAALSTRAAARREAGACASAAFCGCTTGASRFISPAFFRSFAPGNGWGWARCAAACLRRAFRARSALPASRERRRAARCGLPASSSVQVGDVARVGRCRIALLHRVIAFCRLQAAGLSSAPRRAAAATRSLGATSLAPVGQLEDADRDDADRRRRGERHPPALGRVSPAFDASCGPLPTARCAAARIARSILGGVSRECARHAFERGIAFGESRRVHDHSSRTGPSALRSFATA